MRLLVSVRSASEVDAALAGGADIIDAKEPSAGALGAVALPAFREIRRDVRHDIPVSAALGDIVDAAEAEAITRAYASAGASFAKLGFSGTTDRSRVQQVIAAAVCGAEETHRFSSAASCAIVAVAYADAICLGAIEPLALLDCAVRAGARGVLLDTALKHGPGLRDLITPSWLTAWVAQAHASALFAAIAGKLNEGDVSLARDAGADIIGVRGSACDGGRLGVISSDKVRRFRHRMGDAELERAEAAAHTVSGAS